MLLKYLNIPHSYTNMNCIAILAKFYETELKIDLTDERKLFNNFEISSLKDLMEIPLEKVLTMSNWVPVNITELQEFDIIIYTRKKLLTHFSMYVGDLKILDLRENQHSVLRHLNDTQRNNIEGCIRHRQLVT